MHDSCISKCTYSHAAKSLKVKGISSISPANITVLLGTITFLCRQTFGEKRETREKCQLPRSTINTTYSNKQIKIQVFTPSQPVE